MTIETAKYNPAFLSEERLRESFVVRLDALQSILASIRENVGQSNQHVLVIGPRGMGKTMLMRRIAAAIREDAALSGQWHPVVFTEESYNVCSAGEFWLEALFHLGNEAGNERWKKAHEELLMEKDGVRLRERALSQLIGFAEAKDKRILLMVENMGMLFGGQINDNEAWAIRHTLLNEPRIMLIGTALQKFDEIENSDKAMFELFKVYELKPLNKEECGRIWVSITGKTLGDNRIRPVQILTGGNPRLVTIISKFGANISFSALLGDLMRLVDDHTEYFKSHLDNLTPPERKVYTSLLELWSPVSAREAAAAARMEVNETSAILARLVGKGAVVAAPGRGRAKAYQSAERMFNIYWLMRRHGEPSKRVKAIVDFMVHFYGEGEIVGVMRSIAEETCTLTADDSGLLYSAYQGILGALTSARVREKCIEQTPVDFFRSTDAPAGIKNIAGTKAAACYSRGEELFKSGSFEEAIVSFQEAMRLNPQVSVLIALGMTAEKLEKHSMAIEYYDKAIEINPEHSGAWNNKGVVLGKLGMDEAAIECFNKVIEINPEHAGAWNNKGIALGNNGKREAAIECFDAAIKISPKYDASYCNKGVTLAELGKLEAAVDCYDKAIEINSENIKALRNKGDTLVKLGALEAAVECYSKAIAIDPKDVDAWQNKGVTLADLGKHEAAIECHDRVIEINPESADAWNNKGVALGELGKVEDAIECFDRALKVSPENAEVWNNKSILLGRRGKHEAAIECYEKAIKINPENASAWVSKGVALGVLRKYDAAIECFSKAIEINPGHAGAWNNKGIVLGNIGRPEAAVECFDKAIQINPKNSEAWNNKGVAFGELGNIEMELECYAEAIKTNPENAKVWNNKGVALGKLGKPMEEIEAFKIAIRLNPNLKTPRRILNRVLIEQKRIAEALENLKEYYGDSERVKVTIDIAIPLAIDLAAAGFVRETINIINESPSSLLLEPLLAGLRIYNGEEINVPAEVREVAADILKKIEQEIENQNRCKKII